MSVSDKITGIPVLSELWNHGSMGAFLIMLIADFGVICILMMLEGIPPWKRELYMTFKWNDTLVIPLFLAAAVVVMERMSSAPGVLSHSWFHYVILVASFGLSVGVEYLAVKTGQYSVSQELGPSKLWHTLIFGVVGYWLVISLICIVWARSPIWATGIAGIAVICFVYINVIDMVIKPIQETTRVHPEGQWHLKPVPHWKSHQDK